MFGNYLSQAANLTMSAANYIDQNLAQIENHLEQRLEKDPNDPFYYNFSGSDSEILKSSGEISEKIFILVVKKSILRRAKIC